MFSSCLVPAKLPAPTSIFPAIETLTGYLFVWYVGELPRGEQQTSLGTPMWSWSPSISRQPDHPLCSSPAGRMWLQHDVFSISPDLQVTPKPCWTLWWKEVRTSTCPEMGQDKESLSKKASNRSRWAHNGIHFRYDVHSFLQGQLRIYPCNSTGVLPQLGIQI